MHSRAWRTALLLATSFILAACSGSSEQSRTGPLQMSGSVFDGPVVGAEMIISDAHGEVLKQFSSDEFATYELSLLEDIALPVTLRAVGGLDLVTDRPLDFTLLGATFTPGRVTVNVSPLTTVAVLAAQCAPAGLTERNLAEAWRRVHAELGMGLDSRLVKNPMADPVTRRNVESLVLANEALGEAVRRSVQALSGAGMIVTGDELLSHVACNLTGRSQQPSGEPVSRRVVAAFKAAELAVRLETMAGRLEVDGGPASGRMDDSIRQVMPGFLEPSVARVPVTGDARAQTLALISVLAREAGPRLVRAATALQNGPAADVGARLDALLDAQLQGDLQAMVTNIALADEVEIAAVSNRLTSRAAALPPAISLAALPRDVPAGGTTSLSWAASNSDVCLAAGGWTGAVATEGVRQSPSLQQSAEFEVSCVGLGGTTTRSVAVTVDGVPLPEPAPEPQPAPSPAPGPAPAPAPEPAPAPQPAPAPEPAPAPAPDPSPPPAPAPTVSLAAANSVIASGATVGLNWSSTNATSCSASGGWSGSRATSGSQTVGPLTARTTFSLNCSGTGGTAVSMISVAVTAKVSLNWHAPTQNVDGSALTDLAGYRIHYGTSSRNYTSVVTLNSASATSYSVTVPSGTYYFAMTAVDAQGNESAYSNEVIRTVN